MPREPRPRKRTRRVASSCRKWTAPEVAVAYLLRWEAGLEGGALAAAHSSLGLPGGNRSAKAVALTAEALRGCRTLAALRKARKEGAAALLGLPEGDLPLRDAGHPALRRALRGLPPPTLRRLAGEHGSRVAAEELAALPGEAPTAGRAASALLLALAALRRVPDLESAEVRAAGLRISVTPGGFDFAD